jgi:DNA polymerase (family X)
MGKKKLDGITGNLAIRLGRLRQSDRFNPIDEPSAEELLDVDREYRTKAAAGTLPKITPRRFNPKGEAWLPILHTQRGDRHFTALYSNAARAHDFGRVGDWVVLYYDGDPEEGQATVITAHSGGLRGKRIVRGRERECESYYSAPPSERASSA